MAPEPTVMVQRAPETSLGTRRCCCATQVPLPLPTEQTGHRHPPSLPATPLGALQPLLPAGAAVAASRAVGLNAAPCLRRASCRPLGAGSGPWGPCTQAEGIGVRGLLPRPHNLCDVSCPVLTHPRFANCWELRGLKNEEHQFVGCFHNGHPWQGHCQVGDKEPPR